MLARETARRLAARLRLVRGAWGGGGDELTAAAIADMAQGVARRRATACDVRRAGPAAGWRGGALVPEPAAGRRRRDAPRRHVAGGLGRDWVLGGNGRAPALPGPRAWRALGWRRRWIRVACRWRCAACWQRPPAGGLWWMPGWLWREGRSTASPGGIPFGIVPAFTKSSVRPAKVASPCRSAQWTICSPNS